MDKLRLLEEEKLTIIIPHYNSFSSLIVLIDSMGENVECNQVIVVDDRSDNGDYERILDHFKNTTIEIYQNTVGKKGAGTCRNIGLEAATNAWIIFADADDYFVKGAFSVILNVLKNSKDTDIIYFTPTSIDLLTNTIGDRHLKAKRLISSYIKNPNRSNELKLRFLYNAPISFVVKRELLIENSILFDETIVANDTMFSARIGRFAKKIKGCNKIFYCITRSDGSLTTLVDKNKYKIRLDVFIKYYHFFSEEERTLLKISPIPIILAGFSYGQKNPLETIRYLKKNNVRILKNMEFNSVKFIRFLNMNINFFKKNER